MQRTWTDRRRKITFICIALSTFVLLLGLDQFTKLLFKGMNEKEGWTKTPVIEGFFYLRYVKNSGAAWGLFADKSWGQLFFKILTSVALVAFIVAYVFVCKKGYKILNFALILIIAGTIGNFIDRLAYNYVVDFISLVFGDYNFPVFNLADSYMTIGVIMAVVHFLFLDDNAIFKKKPKKEEKLDENANNG